VIEGKIIGAARIDGRVLRIGPRELLVRLDRPLPPLTNVKLRLDYPDGGGESADVYGKVTREEPDAAGPLTRIHFTSMNEADRKVVEAQQPIFAGGVHCINCKQVRSKPEWHRGGWSSRGSPELGEQENGQSRSSALSSINPSPIESNRCNSQGHDALVLESG
jgi:hypothetical protein